jgi:hypothetical protein
MCFLPTLPAACVTSPLLLQTVGPCLTTVDTCLTDVSKLHILSPWWSRKCYCQEILHPHPLMWPRKYQLNDLLPFIVFAKNQPFTNSTHEILLPFVQEILFIATCVPSLPTSTDPHYRSMTKLPEMQKNGFVSTLNKNCIQTYCLDDLYIATYSLPSHGQRVLITVLPG